MLNSPKDTLNFLTAGRSASERVGYLPAKSRYAALPPVDRSRTPPEDPDYAIEELCLLDLMSSHSVSRWLFSILCKALAVHGSMHNTL